MKLKHVLKLLTKDTTKIEEQAHIAALEQHILQSVTNIRKSTMKKQTQKKLYSSFIRQYTASIVAFTIFLVVLAMVFGFIRFQTIEQIGKKEQKNTFTAIKSASAVEVISNTQKAIEAADRIYYRIHQSGVHYFKDVPNGGSTGVGPDPGESRVWYDFKTKNSRSETDHDGTVWAFVTRNNPNGTTTIFEFLPDRNADQAARVKKGIFAKTTHKSSTEEFKQYESSVSFVNQNENPKTLFNNMLKTFEGKSNTKFETVQINNNRYYKLSIDFPYKENPHTIVQTGYILLVEQDTYFPYKETRIYENGKGKVEYTFEEVETEFSDNVFTDAIYPEGYSKLEKGKLQIPSPYSLSLKKCSSEWFGSVTSGIKESCGQGVYGVYDLIASEYTDGKVSIGIGHTETGLFNDNGRNIYDLRFKLFVSKETFVGENEATTAANVEFEELEKAPAGFVEKRKPDGSKKWRKVRMDVYDKNGNKLYDSYSATNAEGVDEVG